MSDERERALERQAETDPAAAQRLEVVRARRGQPRFEGNAVEGSVGGITMTHHAPVRGLFGEPVFMGIPPTARMETMFVLRPAIQAPLVTMADLAVLLRDGRMAQFGDAQTGKTYLVVEAPVTMRR